MASDLFKAFQDDEHVLRFSPQELEQVLGMMESRGDSSTPGACFGLGSDFDGIMGMGSMLQLEGAGVHLQFQPHSPGSLDPGSSSMDDSTHAVAAKASSLGLATYTAPSSVEQQMHVEHIIHAGQNSALPIAAGALSAPQFAPHVATFPTLPAPAASTMQQSAPIQPRSERAQVSHSSVEKQRRDRINSLIDELRDLVPPQKGAPPCTAGSGSRSNDGSSAEARRPKHVVLADTITLLKNWRLNNFQQPTSTQGASSATTNPNQQPGAVGATGAVKEEPVDLSNPGPEPGGGGGGGGGGGMLVDVAPLMPNIPMAISSFAGVTVERAAEPGVMYVQVKCRDRRGLLSDIINALKMLPIEIRTAAVVTSGDGMVRDVFEIRVDDLDLSADAVQNVVHDGLYHQLSLRGEEGNGKRHKV